MGPITYSLCHKPVIGLAMWMLFLCSFPPLFSGETIDLNSAGAKVKTSFHVPVEKSYPLDITFEFSSAEARIKDQIVGNNYIEECKGNVRYEKIPEIRRKDLGKPIPFRIVVRKQSDQSVVLDRTIVSLCITAHGGKEKDRTIGYLPLSTGDYFIEVTNLEKQVGLAGVKTTIGLYGGHGK